MNRDVHGVARLLSCVLFFLSAPSDLFDRLVGTRPLRNRPPLTPPPRASLVLWPAGRRVFPGLLPAVGSQIEQLQGGQHGLDAAPLRFIRLEHLVVGPQVAAEI